MIILTTKEVINLHKKIILRTGGSEGIREYNLLESALQSCETAFENIEKYRTVEEKSARLCYALISNHAFVDGNKRIGIMVMLLTLKLNNFSLEYTQDDLVKLGLSVAKGTYKYQDILHWIKSRIKR